MRKLSQINERLFNGSVQRASSGSSRIEDKTEFERFIEREVEWVDLGHPDVLFSKIDFHPNYAYDDVCALSINEIIEIKEIAAKKFQGIRIMNQNELNFLREKTIIRADRGRIKVCSDSNQEKFVEFQLPTWSSQGLAEYVCDDTERIDDRKTCVIAFNCTKHYVGEACGYFKSPMLLDDKVYVIKLVKEK